ncbi:MAG: hypothetical protein GX270_05700 [Clostridiaceae bacterium]|jgi:uncharacterized protein|nr:hypothetical protein [Clostridiaceae bacterium]
MDRLIKVREVVNMMLRDRKNKEMIIYGAIELYGVSSYCSMLAMRRGLDYEVCSVAGLLLDYASVRMGKEISSRVCASEAVKVLRTIGCFDNNEMELIERMILNVSKEDRNEEQYEELLKDALLLKTYIFNKDIYCSDANKERLKETLKELNIG